MHIFKFNVAELHISSAIAEIIHTNGRNHNPLGIKLREDYIQALNIIEKSPDIRVVIIRAKNGSFCSGGDIKEMVNNHLSRQSNQKEKIIKRINDANNWLERLLNLKPITIAAVSGSAYGAGFSLALHTDFVIASNSAKFCMSFCRVGALPDFGAHYLLPRIVGLGRARELLLTGRTIDAYEAKHQGIVHAIHCDQELHDYSRHIANRFSRGPKEIFSATKKILKVSFQNTYKTIGELEAKGQAEAMNHTYHADAIERFIKKLPLKYNWDVANKRDKF